MTFTDRRAFRSPLAVVVVAAIGLAAVLVQLRLRNREQGTALHPPVLWLNIVGLLLAMTAMFADFLGLNPDLAQMTALGAVGFFAVSSAVILHSFRKQRSKEPS